MIESTLLPKREDFTISETFELPSQGLLYDGKIPKEYTISSMTTQNEMQRLSPTRTPYKLMCDIIEDCLITKFNVYDLTLPDYQHLLYKLRIVTYGSKYNMNITCQNCKSTFIAQTDLDTMPITLLTPEILASLKDEVVLPQSKITVKFKFQTPRDLDRINIRKLEDKEKSNNTSKDNSLLYTLASFIDTINGEKFESIAIETILKALPMRDTQILLQEAEAYNSAFGYKSIITYKCEKCGEEVVIPFRITNEFFGPTNLS